jgi:hypothetical protein
MMEAIDAAVTAQGGDPASFTDRIAMGRYAVGDPAFVT